MDGHVHVVFAREVFSLMPDLYESQQYCDCTLVADDHGESESKHYRAHRIVLSSISKVLRRELESSEGANLIRLVVKPEIVEIFLGLVYSGILRYQHEEEVDGLEALLVHLEMVSVLQMLADCDRSACLLCHQSATSEENEAFSVPELILQEASTSTPPHHSDPTTGSHKIGHLCIHCGKTLLGGLTSYKRHLRVHSGARPFSCSQCGKAYTQKQRLVVHIRRHTGERPYLCSLCGRSFTESCKLKRHLASVHGANKDGTRLKTVSNDLKSQSEKDSGTEHLIHNHQS